MPQTQTVVRAAPNAHAPAAGRCLQPRFMRFNAGPRDAGDKPNGIGRGRGFGLIRRGGGQPLFLALARFILLLQFVFVFAKRRFN